MSESDKKIIVEYDGVDDYMSIDGCYDEGGGGMKFVIASTHLKLIYLISTQNEHKRLPTVLNVFLFCDGKNYRRS